MRIFHHSLIATLLLLVAAFPATLGAQAESNEISDVIWGEPDVVNDVSITVTGTMIHANTDPAPYKFQLEYGYPGTFSTSGGQVQIGGDAEVIGFGPKLLADGSNNDFLGSANDFAMDAGNLYPSQWYYFNIYEWDMSETFGVSKLDYYIIHTARPESVTINLSPYQNGNATLSGVVTTGTNFLTGENLVAGMPIEVYLMTAPSDTDETDPDDVLAAFSAVVGGNGSFTMPLSGLNMNQQYYLKLVNGQSDLALANSIPVIFNDQNTPPPPVDDGNGNGGSLIGTIDSGEDFSNGLVTCSGADCDFEDLLTTISKVLNFLIFIIGVPLVALTFAYGGFLLITSGGSPAKKDQAKGAIGGAVKGFIVLLAAWLLVRTVLLVFGYDGPLLQILGA